MLNLNLMHINDQSFPIDSQDSLGGQNQSIKAANTYQLNSNDSSQQDEQIDYRRSFEIDHSIDDLSLEHDTFLQEIQRGRLTQKAKLAQPPSYLPKDAYDYISVDKNKVEMTLVQSQSTEEVISFTNISSFAIRMKFNQCPFQIHTQKSLSFVQAKQLQIILDPFEQISITFLIKPISNYGDIIETVVITSEFVGRHEAISPIEIHFNVHYVIPSLLVKFQGKTQSIFLAKNKISIVHLKSNKFGDYCLDLCLGEGVPKMNVNVQTRGKMTSFTSNLLLSEDVCSIKLRKKGANYGQQGEKYLLLLRSVQTKVCFMIGIQFIC